MDVGQLLVAAHVCHVAAYDYKIVIFGVDLVDDMIDHLVVVVARSDMQIGKKRDAKLLLLFVCHGVVYHA